MLNLLGVLVACFPSAAGVVQPGAADLYGVCVHILRTEFRKAGTKPDMRGIWGAIACLDNVLCSAPIVVTHGRDTDALFTCVSPPSLSRSNPAAACPPCAS